MAKRILIMGLPGSGKTTLAQHLKEFLETKSTIAHMPNERLVDYETIPHRWSARVKWFNADQVRAEYNDWDFSREGRLRQSIRMFELANNMRNYDFVICDFVAPLPEMRENFQADWTIWLDTIEEGRFQDTNQIFVEPKNYDYRITEQNAEYYATLIGQAILENRRRPKFDWKKPTVQMLGRWQPWHAGHRALFERLIYKTGQVCIMVRDSSGTDQNNPFDFSEVSRRIRKDLDPIFQGQYEILQVPNIVHIGYGRNVGYSISEETFPQVINEISATNIRKQIFGKNKTT